jgi:hypothetical protein
MLLRDHFRDDVDDSEWDGLNGAWPGVMAAAVNRIIPAGYVARPRVRLGTSFEIDLSTYQKPDGNAAAGGHGATTLSRTLTDSVVLLEGDAPTVSEYEVLFFERAGMKLVAALELVSPSNKDRPEAREQFVQKCATLLRNEVSVSIVDIVTNRRKNLYGALQEELMTRRTPISQALLYAVSCKGDRVGRRWRLEAWEHELIVGSILPTIPIWLNHETHVDLDLGATYEDTCTSLLIE